MFAATSKIQAANEEEEEKDKASKPRPRPLKVWAALPPSQVLAVVCTTHTRQHALGAEPKYSSSPGGNSQVLLSAFTQ